MSTPPFISIPDGVALLAPPAAPLPVLLATPAQAPDGNAESRGSVLLVPGFTGSKEDWIAVIAPLAAQGWRVAALDLPGQGGATGLGPRGSHTIESLAAAVIDVARGLSPDEPLHLVGHSMGGLVARELVLAAPQLVASLTLICSGPGPVPESGFAQLQALQHLVDTLPMSEVWAIKEAHDRAGGWVPPSAEVARFCAQRFVANDPAALHDCAELLMTVPDRADQVAATLAARGIPAAVVTGALDDAWPLAEQEAMADRLGAPWHVVAGVGHNPATEDPDATVALLDAAFQSVATPAREDVKGSR